MSDPFADRYVDRDGQPISLERWGELYGDIAYRTIAEDEVTLGWIKTMWIGVDAPELGARVFGTALIDPTSGIWEIGLWATEQEAVAGHGRIVADLNGASSALEAGGPGERHGEADDDR